MAVDCVMMARFICACFVKWVSDFLFAFLEIKGFRDFLAYYFQFEFWLFLLNFCKRVFVELRVFVLFEIVHVL